MNAIEIWLNFDNPEKQEKYLSQIHNSRRCALDRMTRKNELVMSCHFRETKKEIFFPKPLLRLLSRLDFFQAVSRELLSTQAVDTAI